MLDEKEVEALRSLSRKLYGDRAELRVVDPKALKPLGKNARYFSKTAFDQLQENVAKDGMLSSVPYVFERAGEMVVISGNHRVKAAVRAGLRQVLVFVEQWDGDEERKVAVQLSHNALVGQDDKAMLAELWAGLKTLNAKLYAGLDSKLVEELEKIKFSGFGAKGIEMEQMTLWFLPEEVERIEDALEACLRVQQSKHMMMAPLEKYEKLWEALVRVKRLSGLKNAAVAFMLLIDKMAETVEVLEQEELEAGGGVDVEP